MDTTFHHIEKNDINVVKHDPKVIVIFPAKNEEGTILQSALWYTDEIAAIEEEFKEAILGHRKRVPVTNGWGLLRDYRTNIQRY